MEENKQNKQSIRSQEVCFGEYIMASHSRLVTNTSTRDIGNDSQIGASPNKSNWGYAAPSQIDLRKAAILKSRTEQYKKGK